MAPGTMRRWLARAVLGLLALGGLLLGGLVWLEWRPDALQETPVVAGSPDAPPAGAELRLLTWNLGYAGLDASADFFMDGGLQSRARDRATVELNLEGALAFLLAHPADALLLQEVDSPSSRSHQVDQVELLARALPQLYLTRALNYRAAWVPAPLFAPMGRVESGLVTLTRARPSVAVRRQLPGDFAWPVRVFQLKRCVHEVRLPAPDGKAWVLLHHHLATFDQAGRIRREQMTFLRALMLELAGLGHHVVVGGDWNQAFPGLHAGSFSGEEPVPDWYQEIPADWTPPGFTWAFDREVPSLRSTRTPYRPGHTFRTSVDGFLLGPGVELESVRTHDLGFAHSDHNPVEVRVRLEPSTGTPP
jgi:endonuclease/exonuclease/phosphatase family metal-dependent hydrolase